MLTNISRHLSRYKITTTDWVIAEYINNVFAILFIFLAAANLYYGLFGEFVESSLLFLSSDKSKDYTVSTHYRQYSELMVDFCVISDSTIYKDIFDIDNKDDKRAENNDSGKEKDDNWGKKDDERARNPDSGEDKDNG